MLVFLVRVSLLHEQVSIGAASARSPALTRASTRPDSDDVFEFTACAQSLAAFEDSLFDGDVNAMCCF